MIVPAWVVALNLATLAAVPVIGADSIDAVMDAFGEPTGILVQAIQLLGFMLPIVVFRKFIDRRVLASLGYGLRGDFIRDLFLGLFGGIALMAMIFFTIMALGGLEISSIQAPDPSFLTLTITFLLVAIGEESLVRGYVLSNFMDSTNKYVAVLVTSALFAAMHLMNPNVSIIGVVNVALAGIMLGTYYIHRRNLWLPIGLHLTWNLFEGSVFGSAVSGETMPGTTIFAFTKTGPDLITGGGFGFEASIITTLVMVIGTVVLHLVYRDRPSRVARAAV